MVEYDRNSLREQPQAGLRTCIVGIGGAGSNVLDRITLDRTVDAHLICMHTDIRVLSHAMAPNKIQLGADLMRGVGAGGDPDLGREAAMFSRDEIRQALEGHNIIFVCVGLGGGTGSGAAPVVAEIAKTTGALVFVTATMPFSFEGRRRLNQAEEALQALQKRADALILFENNRMGELILPKDGIQKAFSQADQLIAQSLRAVSTIVTMPGLVKLGLDDLTSALSTSNGRCLFGFGEARGQNRGSEALKRALKSPLIDQGRLLHQTKTLLVHIAGGESLTLVEVDAIMKQLGKNVPDQTHILFGVAVDSKLNDSIAVTLISSLGLAQLNAQASAAPPVEMLQHRPAAKAPPLPPAPEPQRKAEPAPVAAVEPAPPPPLPEPLELFKNDLAPPAHLTAPAPAEEEQELFTDSLAVSESIAAIGESAPEEPEAAFEEQEEPAPAMHFEPEPEEEPFTPAAEEETAFSEPEAELEPELDPEPYNPIAEQLARAEEANREPVRPQRSPLMSVTRGAAPAAAPDADAPYAPAGNVKKATPTEQTNFRFGEEDRGRFKDTEPALVQGEDLDVPTWMRLKRKLRK
jgi:cell division protein FtsZ